MGDRLRGKVAVVTGAGRGLGRYGATCNAICPLAKTRLQTHHISVRVVASALSGGGWRSFKWGQGTPRNE